jgi:hypothetical protein
MTIHLSLFLGYNMQAQSPQYEVTWLIRRVFRAMAQLADSYLRAHGLSAADRAVLEFLYPDGALSVPEIAARYQVSRQHVQVTVNTLLDDGFLQSRPNPRHKRSPLPMDDIECTQRTLQAMYFHNLKQGETDESF